MSNENMNSNLPLENNKFVGCGIGFAIAKRDMNVRIGADVSEKIVGFLPRRAQVEVLEILPNGWYKITYPKIAYGYAYVSNVSNRYFSYKSNLEESSPKTTYIVSLKNVTEVKANPQENEETVMMLNKDEVYTIVEEQGEWGKLKNNKGWIHLSNVKRLS
jgi:uncharacterized protein YgiM (DUF1202 family)